MRLTDAGHFITTHLVAPLYLQLRINDETYGKSDYLL